MVETDPDSRGHPQDLTVPDTIAKLDVEDQAMFKRVFAGLFGSEGRRERVGRYELRRMIASGGMGVVYRAFDPKLERDVAIKLISPRPGRDLEFLRERLQREARVLAQLEHANVVSAYDVGVDDGRVFLAMELIVGVTLRERQSREGCSLRDRLRLYIEAGRGLSAAHEAGVVHRDFKPENVFIDERDGVHVGDFGLARFGDGNADEDEDEDDDEQALALAASVVARLTQSGAVRGTLGYMAPEQLRGAQAGPAADQFAFCVALWESITGQLPFVGPSPETYLESMRNGLRGAGLVPRRLRRMLRVGLAYEPQDRHPSMAALLSGLEHEYDRPKTLLRRGLVSLLGLIALGGTSYAYVLHDATKRRCAVVDELGDPRDHERWPELERRGSAQLDARIEDLLAEARAACERDDQAALQRAVGLGHYVLSALDHLPEMDHDEFSAFMHELNLAFASEPSEPMSPAISEFVQSEIQAHQWELQGVRDALDCALDGCAHDDTPRPVSDTDRAELRLRRGRAHALLGHHELALEDYRRAREYARRPPLDDERELRAYIGLARTSIMRLGRVEAGTELLALTRGLPALDQRPSDDLRRLELRELAAVLAKHKGELERALALQQTVVDDLDPTLYRVELVTALVNLGNIQALLERGAEAERSYLEALDLDPDEPEALHNLGLLLSSQPKRAKQARARLGRVAALDGHELRISALIVLLNMDLEAGDAALAEHREQLTPLLDGEPPPTPKQALEGWLLIALSYAAADDFGPSFIDALARAPAPRTTDQQRFYDQVMPLIEALASEAGVALADRTDD